MTHEELAADLDAIATSDPFTESSTELVQEWSAAGVGPEAMEPVLRFMEGHPDIDYGMPGPLAHFVESFYRRDVAYYEAKVVESVARKPTFATVWMLKRLINGTRPGPNKESLVDAMRQAQEHPLADPETRDLIEGFLGE